jgi:hypothetical protein
MDIGGRLKLNFALGEEGWGGMDWIDLARDKDHWRAILKAVMISCFL